MGFWREKSELLGDVSLEKGVSQRMGKIPAIFKNRTELVWNHGSRFHTIFRKLLRKQEY
jgi:hypothetical protein